MTGTLAFIQARMSSSRLPGKVLAPLQGVPMIEYMARRVMRAKRLDGVVVLTSTDPSDHALARTVEAAGLNLFRGELNDVLQRFADAATHFDAKEIVRLTGDCPLIDPAVIDAVIEQRRTMQADYASNVDPPTFPDGLDVECCSRETLELAHRMARSGPQREHVTLWMRDDASGIRRTNVRAVADLSHLRLTVDYADDLEVVRRIVAHETPDQPLDLYDILRVLNAEPALAAPDRHRRNEGLARSLAAAPIPTPPGVSS